MGSRVSEGSGWTAEHGSKQRDVRQKEDKDGKSLILHVLLMDWISPRYLLLDSVENPCWNNTRKNTPLLFDFPSNAPDRARALVRPNSRIKLETRSSDHRLYQRQLRAEIRISKLRLAGLDRGPQQIQKWRCRRSAVLLSFHLTRRTVTAGSILCDRLRAFEPRPRSHRRSSS